jgi:hypothetical protein
LGLAGSVIYPLAQETNGTSTWNRPHGAERGWHGRVPGVANIAKDPQVALGRAIRLRREELGISQQDLGLDVGYDQS